MATRTYYPSCWVLLQIRPEDFLRVKLAPPDPPAVPGDPVSKGGYMGLGYAIIPSECQVNLRSYREGDEAKITIPQGKLPIDPRVIRQCTAQVYMGCLDAQTFAESQSGVLGATTLTLLPQVDPLTGRSNEIFRGFADDIDVTLADGDDTVTITCRDITGFFIDAELPVSALSRIPKTMPIDQVIQQLIIGEPAGLAPPTDIVEDRPTRADARAASKKAKAQLTAVTKRLLKAQAQAAQDPTDASIPAEIARLSAKQSTLTAQLAITTATATVADAIPILAQRLGLPGARGVRVVNETGAPLRPIGALKGASWFDSFDTLKRSKRGGATGGNKRISYWDFITDLVVGCGYICFFRTPTTLQVPVGGVIVDLTPPAELVITEPRTYYPTITSEIRQFVYGFNCDRMNNRRSYTGRNVPTGIVVSAIVDETGGPIYARWPPGPLGYVNRTTANAAGSGDREELTRINTNDRIPQAFAGEALTRIARSIYEQMGKGEFEVTIETDALGTLPSSQATGAVDMLHLRPADPIMVAILPEDVADQPFVTQAGKSAKLFGPDRFEQLTKLGMDPPLASQIAAAEMNPMIQTTFRVKEMVIDFNADSGFTFTIDAINYLDARAALP